MTKAFMLLAPVLRSTVLIVPASSGEWKRVGGGHTKITKSGKRHAVVVFGFLPNGKLDIGDPSVGRESWNTESLAVLWNGEGIQLVRG